MPNKACSESVVICPVFIPDHFLTENNIEHMCKLERLNQDKDTVRPQICTFAIGGRERRIQSKTNIKRTT